MKWSNGGVAAMVLGVIASLAVAMQADAACTAARRQIGHLTSLQGAASARVDRDGASIVLHLGDWVCERDIFVAGDPGGKVSLAVGPALEVGGAGRAEMPTAAEIHDRFGRQLGAARQPRPTISESLGADGPQFGVGGIENKVAIVPDDRDRLWLPLSDIAEPGRVQLFAPGQTRPIFEADIEAKTTELALPLDPGRKGPWKIVLVSGDQRRLGGFTVVPSGAIRARLALYGSLGFNEKLSAIALACAEPELYGLQSYAAYRSDAAASQSYREVLDRLASTGCDGWGPMP